ATNSFQVLTPGTHAFNVVTGEYVPHLLFNAEFYWAVGAVIVVQFILTRTRWGLHTIATGGNPVGAAEAGVDIRMIKIGDFIGVAVLAILNIGFTIAGVCALYFDLIIGLAILASMIANVQVARLKNLGRLQ